MLFNWGINNKTVKELRKNQGFTVKELAEMVRIEPMKIIQIDNLKFKEVPELLKIKIKPILTGEYTDHIPW
ncbi:MAG: transcriptional regulator [Clostridia bacterium]|nr:transcriptional regulator [Clostridia bacterium]MDD4048406.1 transcriptional regulator [Clostridia bacterium]